MEQPPWDLRDAAPEPGPPVPAAPPPVIRRPRDAYAVLVGNLSLLGVGYLMLGRRRLAAGTGLVTLVLLILLIAAFPAVWFEILVALWVAAMAAHGWYLAGGHARRTAVRRDWIVACWVTVPVLLAVGLLRLDAAGIQGSVTRARQHGDCARALAALNGVWLGQWLADAPRAADGERTARACRRLRTAGHDLAVATATGDTATLRSGFDGMRLVLRTLPGHRRMVESTLNTFLSGLSGATPCHAAEVTEWLRQRRSTHDVLDRAAGVVAKDQPAALVGCGDGLLAESQWRPAQQNYQRLLDLYPAHPLAGRARQGAHQATLDLELANVRNQLQATSGSQPPYCSRPAAYSGAPAYGKGTANPALFYGNDKYTSVLPGGWRVSDPAKAVLVVCAGEDKNGTSVQTCPYQGGIPLAGGDSHTDVTFHDIAIPVKAYELRTGRVVFDGTIEIGGTSCPESVTYTQYDNLIDTGPPSDMYVIASDADVRSAFAPVITP